MLIVYTFLKVYYVEFKGYLVAQMQSYTVDL